MLNYTRVDVEPNDIWGFYQENKSEAQKNLLFVAGTTYESIDNYEIYITEENSDLRFVVYHGDNEEGFENVKTEADAISVYKENLDLYLNYRVPDEVFDYELAYESDEEIHLAVYDMLEVFFGGAPESLGFEDSDIVSVAGDIAELLKTKYSIETFYPQTPEYQKVLDEINEVFSRD